MRFADIFRKNKKPQETVNTVPINIFDRNGNMTKQEFIEKMKPLTLTILGEYNIKPIILAAQAAHESNWGDSELTKKANNLFGFTGDSWKQKGKPVIEMSTREFTGGKWVRVTRPFRKYESWLESAKDWASIISTLERYKVAYAYAMKGDMENYADYIAKAGYATDPKYGEKLIKVAVEVRATGIT